MKTLKDRTEIARAINGHEMPVVTIDASNPNGIRAKVLIDNGKFDDGMPFLKKAELRAYKDSSKFSFSEIPAMLTEKISYDDVAEMLEFRNAPIIKPDQDVLIVIVYSKYKSVLYPIILHTSKSFPLYFEDKDYDVKQFLY